MIDGRFDLVEKLGSGGTGTVWRALDRVLPRDVAVKEAGRPSVTGREASPQVRARVLREARAHARISHPSCCPARPCNNARTWAR